VLLSVASCKKDAAAPVAPANITSNNTHIQRKELPASFPTIKDGHLVFADETAFNDYISILQTGQPDDAAAWNSQHNFVSFYDLRQMSQDDARQKGIDPSKVNSIIPADNIFNACLSPYKEIQIGSDIYKIDSPFIIKYTDGHQNEIASMYSAYNSGNFTVGESQSLTQYSADISVIKIPLDRMFKTQSAHSGSFVGIGHEEQYNNFTNDRRMHANIWWQNWYFYKSYGYANESDEQKHWWFIHWWTNTQSSAKKLF
jgi:hypothetical protein